MSENLKPGWRWESFENLKCTVVTAPNGLEYELRAGDIAHPRAQRLFDAMFAALQAQPAAAGVSDAEIGRLFDKSGLSGIHWEGFDAGARAILALRPQAVPMTEVDFVNVEEAAQASFLRHKTSVRGQMVTAADVYEFHLMRAVERFHRIGITAQGAQGGEG